MRMFSCRKKIFSRKKKRAFNSTVGGGGGNVKSLKVITDNVGNV